MRRQVASMLAVSALGVPGAVATASGRHAPKGHPKLVAATVLDETWKRTKRTLQRKRKAAATPRVAVPPQLQQIAQCESQGDPHAIGGGGTYRGKYQFDMSTWASVGGKGDPAAASEAEQDKRAAMLYQRTGPGQWPVCGA